MIGRIGAMAVSIVVTMGCIAASCFAADPAAASPRSRTHDEFVANIPAFPYQADATRGQKIRVGVTALQHCMTAAQVVALLGEPDFTYVAFREGTKDVPQMNILTYVLAQQSERERETDQRVIVWMGMPDELRAVSVWGVHGLTGLEGSAGMRCH